MRTPLFSVRSNRLMFYGSLLLLAILTGNLALIQIGKGDYYYRLSENNRIRIVPRRAFRGRILDRNRKILVDNKPTYTISVVPFEFEQKNDVMIRLQSLLGMTEDEIKKQISRGGLTPYSPIPIKKNVDFETVSILQEHLLDYPGVVYEIEPRRNYLWRSHAAHALGYIGEISVPELRALYQYGYKAGDLIGKMGIEKAYDQFLKGKDGADFLEVRVTGEVVGPVMDRKNIPAIPGADIVTTIDIGLQAFAETLMMDVEAGVFLAMDPRNGEILAMVNRPSFDLSIFSERISDSTWKLLNNPLTYPLLNRSIQGIYPPASVFKIVTALGAIDDGFANALTHLESCHGSLWYGDRWFNCWARKGHGDLTLIQAIAQSCDIYFYQLALRLGMEKWSDLCFKSGFGKKTGIDITPEASGFVPTKDYFTQRYGRRGWGAGAILNLCIGQGELLVTPIQIGQYMCAVANGGNIYKPKIVKEILPSVDRPLIVGDQLNGKLPASNESLRIVKKGLVSTVNDPHGTGILASLPDVVVAGKTGTAQNPHGEDHAWFACYAPADNPRIVLVLLVEQGGSGGAWAHLAGDFLWFYFNIYAPRGSS